MLSQKYWDNIDQGFFLCNVVWSLLDNIPQGFYLFNVGPWLADNYYEEKNLCNVVLTLLGQLCIALVTSKCCLNTSKTTLYKNLFVQCWPKGAQTCFHRKISYTMFSWSTWANIAQENCPCKVGPLFANNFVQKNNLQLCPDISGPTLHKEITCTMLIQSV